ncbi:PadR family transcriptional regulator [Hyalangium rubrum]|uniref:PadR family transcriptional regulator n=1 Tax=Hyalangium rubrum TaxID=3103134 RepID=A0ABU5HHY8_9BACT|nr:PadR family transcriptional regulator [Hyalangium sp. s54d21]MDY7232484.1 PadR family transcriptional regulator [Hyalangium sp. s54d21]
MGDTSLELLQGTLDVLVLKAVSWGPQHGYGVAELIRMHSGEALKVDEGALYPALHRLERRGWLEAEWGVSENNRRAKFYRLTGEGRAQLRAGTQHWLAYSDAVTRVLRSA